MRAHAPVGVTAVRIGATALEAAELKELQEARAGGLGVGARVEIDTVMEEGAAERVEEAAPGPHRQRPARREGEVSAGLGTEADVLGVEPRDLGVGREVDTAVRADRVWLAILAHAEVEGSVELEERDGDRTVAGRAQQGHARIEEGLVELELAEEPEVHPRSPEAPLRADLAGSLEVAEEIVGQQLVHAERASQEEVGLGAAEDGLHQIGAQTGLGQRPDRPASAVVDSARG